MAVQFTAQQAKAARINAQYLKAESSDLGINRSYLLQFESDKLLFDDATLNRLRDYYLKREAPLESMLHRKQTKTADALLNEYAENHRQIGGLQYQTQ